MLCGAVGLAWRQGLRASPPAPNSTAKQRKCAPATVGIISSPPSQSACPSAQPVASSDLIRNSAASLTNAPSSSGSSSAGSGATPGIIHQMFAAQL